MIKATSLSIVFVMLVLPGFGQVSFTPPHVIEAQVVVPPDMSPVSGATVDVHAGIVLGKSIGTSFSDSTGRVRFTDVPAADYTLRVALSGFAPVAVGPFPVNDNEGDNPRISSFIILLSPITWSCPEVTAPVPGEEF